MLKPGAFTGVSTAARQRAAALPVAGQVVSPPPLVRAALRTGDVALAAMFTGTVITGALAPGISWAVLVHCTVVVVLALQSQPLPLGVALAVTPVGSVSVTVRVPVVAAVLAGSSLPTVSE